MCTNLGPGRRRCAHEAVANGDHLCATKKGQQSAFLVWQPYKCTGSATCNIAKSPARHAPCSKRPPLPVCSACSAPLPREPSPPKSGAVPCVHGVGVRLDGGRVRMGRDSRFQRPAHSHLVHPIFSIGLALSIHLPASALPARREISAQACDITVSHCIVDSRESRAGVTLLHSSYTKKLSEKNAHHIVVEHPSGISEYLDKNKKAKAQFRRRDLTGDVFYRPLCPQKIFIFLCAKLFDFKSSLLEAYTKSPLCRPIPGVDFRQART